MLPSMPFTVGYNSSNSMTDFSFAGYDDRDGVHARHFILKISQPGTDVLVQSDYWDTADKVSQDNLVFFK